MDFARFNGFAGNCTLYNSKYNFTICWRKSFANSLAARLSSSIQVCDDLIDGFEQFSIHSIHWTLDGVAILELQLSNCSFRVAVLEPKRYSVHYSGRFRHRMIRISYCSVRSLEFQFVIATLKGFQALDPIHRLLV